MENEKNVTAAENAAAETETVIADTEAAVQQEAEAIAETTAEVVEDAAVQPVQPVTTNLFGGGFFSVIMLAMSLYVLVGGIVGKGKLFQIEGLKKGKEQQAKTTLRIIYVITGLFMSLNTCLSYLRDKMYGYSPEAGVMVRTDYLPKLNLSYKLLNVGSFVMLGITMAGVVAMFVAINRFVDREAARAAQEKAAAAKNGRKAAPGSVFPQDAFEFEDENEEK